jgi:NADPH-dependent curcumin reductase CurA
MTVPATHQVYILAKRPTDCIEPDTFSLQTRSTPKELELGLGQVLVRNIAFSNDPAQRLWMDGSVDPVCLSYKKKCSETNQLAKTLYRTYTGGRGDPLFRDWRSCPQ